VYFPAIVAFSLRNCFVLEAMLFLVSVTADALRTSGHAADPAPVLVRPDPRLLRAVL